MRYLLKATLMPCACKNIILRIKKKRNSRFATLRQLWIRWIRKIRKFMALDLETTGPVPAFRFSSTTSLQLLLVKRWGAVGKSDPEQRNNHTLNTSARTRTWKWTRRTRNGQEGQDVWKVGIPVNRPKALQGLCSWLKEGGWAAMRHHPNRSVK